MTDKEILLDMFKRRQIKYQEYTRKGEDAISIEAGYAGFFSEFKFNEKGDLLSVEAYE